MTNKIELAIVLFAIVAISFIASLDGQNVGTGELERSTRGVAAGGGMLAVIKVFQLYKGKA